MIFRTGVLLLGLLLAGPAAAAGDDAFTKGYVAAVLERELGVPHARVRVEDGAVSARSSCSGTACTA